MEIGGVRLTAPLILAPMAGVSNMVFRGMCRRAGAGLTFTEMVSVEGLIRKNIGTMRLVRTSDDEHPVGIQLFGSSPTSFAEAAQIAESMGFDVIDINAGCPVRKVVSHGAGSVLLKNIELLSEIVNATVSSVSLPVWVKIRSGWDDDSLNFLETATALESAGASAVTLHPRTRAQAFTGQANWEHISRLVDAVHIDVIGNGDVRTPHDAVAMFSETGCKAVMIGRTTRGNPFIFTRTAEYISTGILPPRPSSRRLALFARDIVKRMISFYGERIGISQSKAHLIPLVTGLSDARALRRTVGNAHRIEDLEEVFFAIESGGHKVAVA